MASICHRCALRLQRAAQTESQHISRRTFTSTSNRRKTLPTFNETSNPELNNVLAHLRDKHFIPAFASEQERKMMYKEKHRQYLQDNPQKAIVGGQEVDLQWIDRRRDVENRSKLVKQAINMIVEGDSKEWQNLPKLLMALNEGVKKPASSSQMEKLIRKAVSNGKFAFIVQCLNSGAKTGMTLKDENVLRSVVIALREAAQGSGWSEGGTARALRDANVVAQLLESEEHGSGRRLQQNDPRTRPEVLGVFLELAAVYAYKFQDAKDTQGLVKAYAGRLMSNLQNAEIKPEDFQLVKSDKFTSGHQSHMLYAISIWHGLSLAYNILGKDMPQATVASKATEDYQDELNRLAAKIEAKNPMPETYLDYALRSWDLCIRD